MELNNQEIFANYNEKTVRVYQAYRDEIAHEATKLQTFGKHFKLERMTWIKPSFLWMMYRSGWATKQGQENILAIDIKRESFNEILKKVVLSSFNPEVYKSKEDWKECLAKSEVRCQWDPERDIYGNPLNKRSIQLGIKGKMVISYVKDWIVKITDITPEVQKWREQIKNKEFDLSVLPVEIKYPVNNETKKIIGMI